MISFKNSLQVQNEYSNNKSKKYSSASTQSNNYTGNKIPSNIEQVTIHSSNSKDTNRKNLTQRIKKAKNEIYQSNNQKKSKVSQKQNSRDASNMEIETSQISKIFGINKGNTQIIFNNENQFNNENLLNNHDNQLSSQNYQNRSINRIFQDSGVKINIFNENIMDIQNQREILYDQLGQVKEDLENEQLQSDVNSNQIECSGSNRPFGGQDDSFMDDFILQNNKQFNLQIPLIGENDSDESISNKQINQEGEKKDIDKKKTLQQQQIKRRRKKKDSISNSDKQNEEHITTQLKTKKGNAGIYATDVKQKREYKRKNV